ncbi:MAG TPA: lysophospholipid acyltransferase family protein [Gemmatimonadales bacterium]|nr:lysophospholipid acyltransferase family protein [Gemmatimonadales bacterium]
MKLRIPLSAARAVAPPAMRLIAGSWRMSTQHEERWRSLYESRRPIVYLLWHEALLPLLWHHRRQGVVIVVSENRDGQYLSDFARVLGYRSVRGSSSRGAARALLGAVRELKSGFSVAFTPDGPRGPRRELKPGFVAAAQRGGGVIVPVHAEADRAWRLHSWDRFLIPKPGARVMVTYGRPFEVSPGEEGLAAGLVEAGVRLAEIAEAWG